MRFVKWFINKFSSKHVNLKEKGIAFVRENFGEEYVEEFCDKYDRINKGIPIGGFTETAVFLDLIEKIKSVTIQRDVYR